jgi:hypothetical protein
MNNAGEKFGSTLLAGIRASDSLFTVERARPVTNRSGAGLK